MFRIRQQDWKCISDLRPRFKMKLQLNAWIRILIQNLKNSTNFVFKTLEHFLISVFFTLLSNKIKTISALITMLSIEYQQRHVVMKTSNKSYVAQVVTCRTAIAKLCRGQKTRRQKWQNESQYNQREKCLVFRAAPRRCASPFRISLGFVLIDLWCR